MDRCIAIVSWYEDTGNYSQCKNTQSSHRLDRLCGSHGRTRDTGRHMRVILWNKVQVWNRNGK